MRASIREVPYLATFQKETRILPSDEIRALWVVRDALASMEKIDRLVDFAIRGRFHILFAQVRGRGDAYYVSEIEPGGPDLEAPLTDFDPLAYLLDRAHEAGIAVHAWVNVFYVWSNPNADPPPGHIIHRHPNWLITGPDGIRVDAHGVDAWKSDGVEGYFLSPADSAARSYTVGVIKDIATRYPIDGVHLDYIRYPAPGFGFSAEARRQFMLYWGVDPLELLRNRERLTGLAGEGAIATLDSLAAEKRVQAVDSLVYAVREAIAGLPLSAAVIPDPDRARIDKAQDWVRWVQSGHVDFVVPMAYTYAPAELGRRMTFVRNIIGKDKFLVGLPLFDGRVRNLASSVSVLRDVGVQGYALFSYNVIESWRFVAGFLNSVFFGEQEETPSP